MDCILELHHRYLIRKNADPLFQSEPGQPVECFVLEESDKHILLEIGTETMWVAKNKIIDEKGDPVFGTWTLVETLGKVEPPNEEKE